MVTEDFRSTTLFNRYFHLKGTALKERGKLQNFPYTTYYNDWFKLMSQLSEGDAKVVRSGLLWEFKQLKWKEVIEGLQARCRGKIGPSIQRVPNLRLVPKLQSISGPGLLSWGRGRGSGL